MRYVVRTTKMGCCKNWKAILYNILATKRVEMWYRSVFTYAYHNGRAILMQTSPAEREKKTWNKCEILNNSDTLIQVCMQHSQISCPNVKYIRPLCFVARAKEFFLNVKLVKWKCNVTPLPRYIDWKFNELVFVQFCILFSEKFAVRGKTNVSNFFFLFFPFFHIEFTSRISIGIGAQWKTHRLLLVSFGA